MVARDVSTRGARIRFVDDGSGAPLIFLHDALASHETFAATARHLTGESAEVEGSPSFRVVAPDLPGFGASEKPDPHRYAYGWDAFADSVADLIAGLGLGRVNVCGHAMGGGIALALAARHPALVHRLVLVDALVYPTGDHYLERAGRIPLAGALLWRQTMSRALFRNYIENSVYAGCANVPAGRVDAFFASFDEPAARQAAHASLVAKADTRSLVARLPRVTAESLVIWGRNDALAPVDHGRRLSRALKGRFEVLECGRCPPDEQPTAFASVLASFLQATPSMRAPSSRTFPRVP